MTRITLLIFVLIYTASGLASEASDKAAEIAFLKKHKLTSTGFGPILLDMTMKEGLTAAGLGYLDEDNVDQYECGSYILPKPRPKHGSNSSDWKLRLYADQGIIRRIDVWDSSIETIFSVKLGGEYSPLSKKFAHGEKTIPENAVDGKQHFFLLNNSDVYLFITEGRGKVRELSLGKYPDIIEGGCH